MSAGCQSCDVVQHRPGGFYLVFMPNDVKRLGNNYAKAIPVPGVVFGITIRKYGYIQEDWVAL
jgi:hypothetical protein